MRLKDKPQGKLEVFSETMARPVRKETVKDRMGREFSGNRKSVGQKRTTMKKQIDGSNAKTRIKNKLVLDIVKQNEGELLGFDDRRGSKGVNSIKSKKYKKRSVSKPKAKKKGRIVVNMGKKEKIEKSRSQNTTVDKKKKDLKKEIKDLKKKLKRYRKKKDESGPNKIIRSHNYVKNKIICINTNVSKIKQKETVYKTRCSSDKVNFNARTRSLHQTNSPPLCLNPKIKRKAKIKSKNGATELIKSKNRNSLKELIDNYNRLKKSKDNSVTDLDPRKLKRMKEKVQNIYNLIDKKLKRANKPKKLVIDKALLKRRNDAAIVIQKHTRGYLVRKLLMKLCISPNPTFNTMEDINNFITEKSFITQKQSSLKETVKESISNDRSEQRSSALKRSEKKISLNYIPDQLNNDDSKIRFFVADEFHNWNKMGQILSEINNVIKTNFTNNKNLEDLFEKVREITSKNVNKYRSGMDIPVTSFKELKKTNQSKSSKNSIVSKPTENVKLILSQSHSQKMLKKADLEMKSEEKVNTNKSSKTLMKKDSTDDKFFYTDRNNKNSSKVLSQFVETISRDISKISVADKTPVKSISDSQKLNLKNQLNSLNNFSLKFQKNEDTAQTDLGQEGGLVIAENKSEVFLKPNLINIIDENTSLQNKSNVDFKRCPSDFELQEVSFDHLVKSMGINTNETAEHILDYLIDDFMSDQLWMLLFEDNAAPDLPLDEEAIYGIRTNINAVCEYCNLLIKFIEDHYYNHLFLKTAEYKMIGFSLEDYGFHKEPLVNDEIKTWLRPTHHELLLNEQTYIELENQILDNYKGMNIMATLFEMQKIYHRCVFDAFNEILSTLLFGKKKLELNGNEWKIIKKSSYDKNEFIFILHKSKMLLLEYSMYLCGLLKNKEDSMMGMSLKNFDNESINVIREEKLFMMISKDMKEKRGTLDCSDQIDKTSEGIKNKLAQKIEDTLLEDLIKNFLF